MKNTIKLLGVIALVAVIGFSMSSCKEDDDVGLSGVFKIVRDPTNSVAGEYAIEFSGGANVNCIVRVSLTWNGGSKDVYAELDQGGSGALAADRIRAQLQANINDFTFALGDGSSVKITTPQGVNNTIRGTITVDKR